MAAGNHAGPGIDAMNTYTRIALAAGLLAVPLAPAFAQNGTPPTGVTSPTPSAHPPQPAENTAHAPAQASKTPMAKTHRTAKSAATPAAAKSN
jgi:hypothetical protein